MLTTARLRWHELDLIPQGENEIWSVMFAFLGNSTLFLEDGEESINEIQAIKSKFYNHSLNNASFSEALDVLLLHKRRLNHIFLPLLEYGLITIYCALMIWGVVSNCLVCFVVMRQCSRKLLPNTGPTPRNLYIVNLAFADLLLCLICMPFTLLSLLHRPWSLGVIICKLVPLVQGANIMVSSGTITAIALDRYFTIVAAPKSRRLCQCSVTVTLLFIWLISLIIILPMCYYQQVQVIEIAGIEVYEVCLEQWPSRKWQQVYAIVSITVQFLLPGVAIATMHIKISLYLNVHLNNPLRKNSREKANREWKRYRRTMYILSCIAIVFTISWLPLSLYTIVIEFYPSLFKSPESLYMTFSICHIIAMSSASTNPLLYGYLNTNFRHDLTNSIYGLCGKTPPPRTQHARRMTENRLDFTNRREGKLEPVSIIVTSRDRRISSSFGTTLTTTFTSRTRSSISQHRIEEI